MSPEQSEIAEFTDTKSFTVLLRSRYCEAGLLAVLVVAGFLLRYANINPYQVIAADGPSYVNIAREILTSHTVKSSIHYPPFYPFLIAVTSFFIADFETAGVFVSLVTGALLVVPVYLLGKSLFGRGAGWIAAAVTVVWPEFVFQSCNVLAYSTYFLVLMAGLYFLWRAHADKSAACAVFSALFTAAAYLSRQEAFISMTAVCFLMGGVTLVHERSFRNLKHLLLAYGTFVLLCTPYIVMVHQIMGIWTLAGKSVVTLTDCLGYYLQRPDLNRDPTFGKTSYLDLFTKYPGYFSFIFQKNYAELLKALPVPLVLAAVAGFFCRTKHRSRQDVMAFIVGALAPVLVLLTIFLVSSAYIAPYIPFLLILAGHGMVSVEGWFAERFGLERNGFCYLSALLITAYLLTSAYRQVPLRKPAPYDMAMDGGRYDQKRLGKLLKKHLPPGAVTMTRSGRIAFYSGVAMVDMPQTDLNGILQRARESKARYMVVHGELVYMRPQLGPLLMPFAAGSNGLALYEKGEEVLPGVFKKLQYLDPESQGMVVYELEP